MNYQLNVSVSPNARTQFVRLIQNERSFNAIPSIVWATDNASGRAEWIIGFYDRSKVPGDFIVDADGVELVVEPQWREALNGARIDVFEGQLSVQGGKPG